MSKIRLAVLAFVLFLELPAVATSLAQAQSESGPSRKYALIIGGAGGQEQFTEKYFVQTSRLYQLLTDSLGYLPEDVVYLFEQTSFDSLQIDGVASADNVREAFRTFKRKLGRNDQLLVFLTGHGAFDGQWGKFNLVGPDLKDIEYARLLSSLASRKVIFANMSAASGAFIRRLSDKRRVVITSTKSGAQHFETNFADFFIDALASRAADKNKDKRVSMVEAFAFARKSQDTWFEEKRLVRAEHPLLDDNGDGQGSQSLEDSEDGLLAARLYLGSRDDEMAATRERMQSGSDSPRDKLVVQKGKLEEEIADLKARKAELPAEQYAGELENLLVRLARVSKEIKALDSAPAEPPASKN